MPRGGRRRGRPGARYSNRGDLRTSLPPQAATGQQYGQAGAQLAAQQAVPMGRAPAPSGPPPSGAPRAAPPEPPAGPAPGGLGDLLRPTERENEPLTAGIPLGAGPGPEVLDDLTPPPTALPPDVSEEAANELRGIYLRFPYPEVAELLEELETEGL